MDIKVVAEIKELDVLPSPKNFGIDKMVAISGGKFALHLF